MNFDAHARSQAQVLLDAVANHVADQARAELDALRGLIEERATALQKALAHPDQAGIIERLVKDVSIAARKQADIAREQAEAAAAKARAAAEETAKAELSAARKEIEERAQAEFAAARAAATAQAEAAQAVNATLLTNVEEARQQLKTAQAAAQADIDHTRQEVDALLDQAQAEHNLLAAKLADAERDLAAARAERDTQAASIDQAKKNAQVQQQERKQLLLARDESAKLLEAEKRRATELAGAMETARQEANLAKVEAERHRNDLKLATARLLSYEGEGAMLDAEVQSPVQGRERGHTDVALLEEIRATLQSMYAATTANEILESLLEQLAHHFSTAAVFLVGPSGARGWRSRSFGTTTDISASAIPRGISSLLSRTVADQKPASVPNGGDAAPIGLSKGPIASAAALPVLARGQVIAVAYVEDEQSSSALANVGYKIAEMLIDHVSRRLTTTKRTSAQASIGTPQDIDQLGAVPSTAQRSGAYSAAPRQPA